MVARRPLVRISGRVVELPSGDTIVGTDLDNSATSLMLAEMALGLADALNVAQFLDNRVADSLDALTYVDVIGSTNLDVTTPGMLQPLRALGSDISTSAMALSGGDFAGSPKGNGFDNNAATLWLSSQTSGAVAAVSWLGQDFITPREITSVVLTQGTATNQTINSVFVEYSDNGTSWTGVAGSPFTIVKNLLAQTLSFASVGLHRYWRLRANGTPGPGKSWGIVEAEFKPLTTTAVLVRSEAFAAGFVPTAVKMVAKARFVDSVLPGTDFKLSVSRNGGTSWSYATLYDRFVLNGLHVLESDPVNVSGQPSGMSIKWRWETANAKLSELHDIFLYWS